MTAADLTRQILALPVAERAAIAQEVWESIEDASSAISPEAEAEAVQLAQRRDKEMSQGDVPSRSHEEVMRNARRSIACE